MLFPKLIASCVTCTFLYSSGFFSSIPLKILREADLSKTKTETTVVKPAAVTKPAAVIKTSAPASTEPVYKTGKVYAPVLMYHHIGKKIGDNPYFVEPSMFEQQMAWLKANNYNVISYDVFYNGIFKNSQLPERPVVITFDDGDKDQYLNAYPILKKYGYTATFFIITNSVGGQSYMSWDMLKDMVKNGMDIESHSVHHPNMARLDFGATDYELLKSKEKLEEKLGIKIKYFAYPGGAFSGITIEELQKLGYLSAVTVRHTQYHTEKDNVYTVGRMHIDSDMESFAGFVTGHREN